MADSELPFRVLCDLYEKIAVKSKKLDKRRVLQSFFRKYDEQENSDPFPIMRLLCPEIDKDRQMYGIKEAGAAKAYVDALNMNTASKDAQRLLHWKNPERASGRGDAVGEFSTVLEEVLQFRAAEQSTLSVRDVNERLSKLSRKHDDKAERRSIISLFLRQCTARENKWIIRIILKDLKISFGFEAVLDVFHRQAKEMYNKTSSLVKICTELRDANATVSFTNIELFSNVRSMLASRRSIAEVVRSMKNGFLIENKYDGERIQIHRDGNRVEYYSRNNNVRTSQYRLFNDVLLANLKVDKVILDGEIIGWDNKRECFVEFGILRAIAEKNSNWDRNHQLCFICFDIIMFDGQNVMGETLLKRRDLVERAITIVPHQLETSPAKRASTSDEINCAMDEALFHREEGIMVKDIGSTYQPGERAAAWVKLKPDYIDGMGETLDLIVLGGMYGSKSANGLSSFLLGLATPAQPNKTPDRFLTICKVGTGYNTRLLAAINERLAPFLQDDMPSLYAECGTKDERPDKWVRPENSFIFEVRCGEIVPSKKFAIHYTLRFPRVHRVREDKLWHQCMTTSEFGRLLHAADDAAERRNRANASASLSYSLSAPQASQGASAPPTTGSPARKKARLGKASVEIVPTVPSHFRDTDTRDVRAECDLFAGIEFVVLSESTRYPKDRIERLIVQGGGSKSQNPTRRTQYLVAVDASGARVQTASKANELDIITPQYILDCHSKGSLLPLTRGYLVHATPASEERLRRLADRYGDSYTHDVSEADLRSIFSTMGDDDAGDGSHSSQPLATRSSVDWTRALLGETVAESEAFSSLDADERNLVLGAPAHRFHGFLVYFDMFASVLLADQPCTDDSPPPVVDQDVYLAALQARSVGARTAATLAQPRITHVVVSPDISADRLASIRAVLNDKRRAEHRAQFIVTPEWIHAAAKLSDRGAMSDLARDSKFRPSVER